MITFFDNRDVDGRECISQRHPIRVDCVHRNVSGPLGADFEERCFAMQLFGLILPTKCLVLTDIAQRFPDLAPRHRCLFVQGSRGTGAGPVLRIPSVSGIGRSGPCVSRSGYFRRVIFFSFFAHRTLLFLKYSASTSCSGLIAHPSEIQSISNCARTKPVPPIVEGGGNNASIGISAGYNKFSAGTTHLFLQISAE